jgi:hypothetical protein
MSSMNDLAARRAVALGLVLLSACRGAATGGPATRAVAAAAVPAAAAQTAPHGDHNPHHGGVVLMKGELHYEVVLDATGREHRLFLSDAVRDELPASLASSVSVTVRRPGEGDEVIPFQIDGAGESWIGSGRRVANPSKTTVRVAFTVANDPYWIDIGFAR